MHENGCIICNRNLVYQQTPVELECHICGKYFKANAQCTSGHFVCDNCHSLGALDYIEKFCINSLDTNPLAMAITLMKNENLKMHGPEHHFLVPAVLLTAYYNLSNDTENKIKKIAIARERAANVPGGFCGFHGACGAGIGTGIFVSLITGATPLSKNEWKFSNQMTSKSLQSISANGGPRCCKRNTYLAISEAICFLQENFNINLNTDESTPVIRCGFYKRNRECLHKECKFFNGSVQER